MFVGIRGDILGLSYDEPVFPFKFAAYINNSGDQATALTHNARSSHQIRQIN